MDAKQREYRDRLVGQLAPQPEEADGQFEKRKTNVVNAFVVSVTIAAKNGELLTGNREEIFDDLNFPSSPKSVFYSTQSVPNAVLNHVPQDRITLFLDFSQPSMFDFGRLPTLATPNESAFDIAAVNESWFAASKTKLSEFFTERRSRFDWLHAAGAYDGLLVVMGLPLAVWTCVRLESLAPQIDYLSAIPKALAYCYAFILSLFVFRGLFSYSRWVFPKIEIERDRHDSILRHRAAWVFILCSALAPAIYDVVKFMLGTILRAG
jgi:hypothetical protein